MADLGYWTGSLVYTPYYNPAGFTIPFGGTDANGVNWLWMVIDGWDSPDVSGAVVQRASDHGGWPTAQYYAPRTLTLTCMASAPTQALRDLARAALQQAVPINDLATLTLNEPVPKYVKVRRSGKIQESYPTLTDVQFQCVLVAPDPRKYTAVNRVIQTVLQISSSIGITLPSAVPFTLPAQAPGGSVTVSNNGSFETRPVITLTGPVTGPSVRNSSTGQTVSWSTLTLNTGDTLVIDMDSRTGLYNGALRLPDLVSSWWVLNPGVNNLIFSGTSTPGGAIMSVSFYDAWI